MPSRVSRGCGLHGRNVPFGAAQGGAELFRTVGTYALAVTELRSANLDSKRANSRNISRCASSPPSAPVTETRGHFNTRLDVVTEGTSGRETARSLVRRCPNPSRRGRAALSWRSREGKPREKPLRSRFPVSDAGIGGRTRAGLARFRATARGVASAPRAQPRRSSNPQLELDAPPRARDAPRR